MKTGKQTRNVGEADFWLFLQELLVYSSVHYQHTNTSLQNNIPHFEYNPNIQIHSLQNNIHVSKVPVMIAGVPSSQAPPGFLITTHHLCVFLMQSARG